jgi:TolB protein
VLALGALPASAVADVPAEAPNGKLTFASGRDDGATVFTDGTSQIWVMNGPGGGPSRLTPTDGLHHRHPAWSPDHTKIVYAQGAAGFVGPWDLFVRDLVTGTTTNITDTDPAGSVDRASWSPDGTKVAYQKTVGANVDVMVRPADGTGGETLVGDNAEDAAGAEVPFTRPHWTPDGQRILYAREDTAVVGDKHDIFRSAAAGGDTTGTVVVDGADDDYQPYVSPDGTKFCFTRDPGATKDVLILPISGAGAPTTLATGGENFECAWSPDGNKVAFGRGGFSAGQILMRDSDGAPASEDPVTGIVARFDGNVDWAPNFPPTCDDRGVSVPVNGDAVTIPLSCLDPDSAFGPLSPPTVAPLGSTALELVSQPGNGVLGSINNDESILYTPNLNFKGTDSFTYKGNDDQSDDPAHDSNIARVTINVGTGTGPGAKDTTKPSLTSLRVSPRTFRRGTALPKIAARKGTRISFRLSEIAKVKLSFAKATSGRRVGGKCRKRTRANSGRRKCTRYVNVGSFTVQGKTGANRVSFSGRLSRRKKLSLGRYKLSTRATDGSGNRGTVKTARLRVVRR